VDASPIDDRTGIGGHPTRLTAAADARDTHQRVGVCDCVWVR
jgi:hypothetical protein